MKGLPKCKFLDPWDRGSYARAWPYNLYNENALFLLKNLLLYFQAQFRQTKYNVMIYKEGVYRNCKFHDPRGRGSCARAWLYKFQNENALFLLQSQAQIRQPKYNIRMVNEESIKIESLIHNPRGRGGGVRAWLTLLKTSLLLKVQRNTKRQF